MIPLFALVGMATASIATGVYCASVAAGFAVLGVLVVFAAFFADAADDIVEAIKSSKE